MRDVRRRLAAGAIGKDLGRSALLVCHQGQAGDAQVGTIQAGIAWSHVTLIVPRRRDPGGGHRCKISVRSDADFRCRGIPAGDGRDH
jgi:hypothetical protein